MLRFFTPLRFVQNDTERFVQNDMGDYAWEDMRVVGAYPAISLRSFAPFSPCERGLLVCVVMRFVCSARLLESRCR